MYREQENTKRKLKSKASGKAPERSGLPELERSDRMGTAQAEEHSTLRKREMALCKQRVESGGEKGAQNDSGTIYLGERAEVVFALGASLVAQW